MSGRHAAALINSGAPRHRPGLFKKNGSGDEIVEIDRISHVYLFFQHNHRSEAVKCCRRLPLLQAHEKICRIGIGAGEIALIESVSAFNNLSKMFEDDYKLANEYFNGGSSKIFNSDTIITFGVPLTLFLYHQSRDRCSGWWS